MIEKQCEREVVELHQFFEDWFRGVLVNGDEAYGRFADVMAEGFRIVAPSGDMRQREPLLVGLRQAHGSWQGQESARIWIENCQVHWQKGDIILATYEEWQELNGKTTARLSSVLFQIQAGAPNGLVWLHVHETWMNPES